jgi:hypothetical protein
MANITIVKARRSGGAYCVAGHFMANVEAVVTWVRGHLAVPDVAREDALAGLVGLSIR